MAAGWWVISQGGTQTVIHADQAGAAAAGTVVSGPYATMAQAQAAISAKNTNPLPGGPLRRRLPRRSPPT